jgi:hypothetical protein
LAAIAARGALSAWRFFISRCYFPPTSSEGGISSSFLLEKLSMNRTLTRSLQSFGRSLRPTVTSALLLLAIWSAARPLQAEPWSQFQGNAAHTGYVNATSVPLLTAPNWTFKTIRFFDPTPAVSFVPGIASDGENVFLSWRGSPSTVAGVSAVNIQTGEESWEWLFQGNDSEDLSAPAYDGGKLYVHRWGHSSSSDKPRLFGINATNGQQIFDQSHSGQWSSGGRPTATGGQVYVAGGYYGGLDNYNGTTGTIQWFAGMPQEYGWIPAVDNGKVYTSFDGNLTMVNAANGTGAQTLLAPSGGNFYDGSSPLAAGPHEAYAAYGGLVTQFDPTNKYPTWEYKNLGGSANQGMALSDNALFINFGNNIAAIDRATGAQLWRLNMSGLTSNLVLTNSHLFVGDSNKTYAINLLTRNIDWQAPYSGDLAIVSDVLFVSNTRTLSAFNLTVPEPSSAVLLLPLVVVLGLIRRRKKHQRVGSMLGAGNGG